MAARWRVINPGTPRSELGPDSRFRDVMDVTFEVLDTGTTGYVTVPVSHYTQEQVAALIQPLADNIAAVGAMSRE